MKKAIQSTYRKYGYKMFECSMDDFDDYNFRCYFFSKKEPRPEQVFEYKKFKSVDQARHLIKHILIPTACGDLPHVKWHLLDSQTLVKEVWFYEYSDQKLYQCAVERAWALGGHLDPRVKQLYYD